jgi:hypothetical protein
MSFEYRVRAEAYHEYASALYSQQTEQEWQPFGRVLSALDERLDTQPVFETWQPGICQACTEAWDIPAEQAQKILDRASGREAPVPQSIYDKREARWQIWFDPDELDLAFQPAAPPQREVVDIPPPRHYTVTWPGATPMPPKAAAALGAVPTPE